MGPRIRGTPHFWPAWNVGHDTFRSDELPGVGAAFALLAGSRRPMGRNLGGAGCSDQTLHGSSFAGCFALETMASLDLGSADGVGPVGHKPDASRAEDVRQLLYLAPNKSRAGMGLCGVDEPISARNDTQAHARSNRWRIAGHEPSLLGVRINPNCRNRMASLSSGSRICVESPSLGPVGADHLSGNPGALLRDVVAGVAADLEGARENATGSSG